MFDISGRVRELRNEILELMQANEFAKYKPSYEAGDDRHRREQRLIEIKLELADLRKRLKSTP